MKCEYFILEIYVYIYRVTTEEFQKDPWGFIMQQLKLHVNIKLAFSGLTRYDNNIVKINLRNSERRTIN